MVNGEGGPKLNCREGDRDSESMNDVGDGGLRDLTDEGCEEEHEDRHRQTAYTSDRSGPPPPLFRFRSVCGMSSLPPKLPPCRRVTRRSFQRAARSPTCPARRNPRWAQYHHPPGSAHRFPGVHSDSPFITPFISSTTLAASSVSMMEMKAMDMATGTAILRAGTEVNMAAN